MKLATVNPVFGLMVHPEAMPAQLDVSAVAKLEAPHRVVGIDLVLAAPDDVHAHLKAIAAASISDIVEILERGEIVQLGSVAAGAYTADVAPGRIRFATLRWLYRRY